MSTPHDKPGKEAELPINALRHELLELKKFVERQDKSIRDLEDSVGTLEVRLRHQRKLMMNFVGRFGRYINTEGKDAGMFITQEMLNAGAYGIALGPRQGLIEDLLLEVKTEPVRGQPCLIPELVAWEAEEPVEDFSPELVTVGADT